MTDETMPSERARTVLAASATLGEWLGFSASYIKSGEAWSRTCEAKRSEARLALTILSELAANPALAEQPVPAGGWRNIASAPDLERVWVAGWQARQGHTAGYWWWHEDLVSDGRAIEHLEATLWFPITLPTFPAAPAPSADREGA